MTISNFEFRFLMNHSHGSLFAFANYLSLRFRFGSATAALSKRPTPPEFRKSKIKNQKSEIVHLNGGER